MTGYGLTVFEGTKPDRFAVRVVGVLHNFMPKQDLILIRSEDPRLVHSGVVAGMSGSPIYIEGRLAGALSYGWSFSRDPIAGVTPIANMQSELRRPLRGRQHTPAAEAGLTPTCPTKDAPCHSGSSLLQPRRSVDDALASYRASESRQPRFLDRDPLPPVPLTGASSSLVRASVPLTLAGFTAEAFDQLARALAPYHMTPLAAGGAPRPNAVGPERFESGGAIAVNLVRGDINAAGTGTVTLIEGDRVAGFGHPMFNVGEIYLPISTAEIPTIMSAYSSSFKFATPLREVGSLIQDRQSCIVGDVGLRADMIPVRVRVGGPGRNERSFNAEVVRHRFLTPMLASSVVGSSIQEAASDVADATITVRTELDVRGYSKLSLIDHTFSTEGVTQSKIASTTGLKAIGEILFNPFAPTHLDRIDIQVDVDYKPDVAEIVGVALRSDEVIAGTRPALQVTLRPYNGAEYTENVPLDIPLGGGGSTLKIEVAAGNLAKPDVAPPENLPSLLQNLTKVYPARSIVVTLQSPDEGLILRGTMLPSLPASVIDTLRPGASTRRGEAYKLTSRIVIPTRGVVLGKRELQVKIKEPTAG